jgi:hypothetical protein
MSGTSETRQWASSGPLVPQTLAAIFRGEPPLADGLTEAIRRLSVLVEVADGYATAFARSSAAASDRADR